eukprot:1159235-Pelagomonas_calceolata.AAC.14
MLIQEAAADLICQMATYEGHVREAMVEAGCVDALAMLLPGDAAQRSEVQLSTYLGLSALLSSNLIQQIAYLLSVKYDACNNKGLESQAVFHMLSILLDPLQVAHGGAIRLPGAWRVEAPKACLQLQVRQAACGSAESNGGNQLVDLPSSLRGDTTSLNGTIYQTV